VRHDRSGAWREEKFVRRLQSALYGRCGRPIIGLVIIVTAILLTVAACGGDGKATEQPTGTATAPLESTLGPSQMDTELSQKLKDLSAEWAKASVKATYDIASLSGTETSKSTMILYWDPPKVRADISSDVGGAVTQASVISTPDKIYDCTQEGGEQCLAYPAVENVADVLPFLNEFDPGAVEATLSASAGTLKIESSDEKVGKQDASCVSAEGSLGGQEGLGKWCFAGNGLLVFESTADPQGTSQFTLQATDVSEVSDSDFDPPYPVTEVTPSPTTTPTVLATATPGG
jgi:hypothetical protein